MNQDPLSRLRHLADQAGERLWSFNLNRMPWWQAWPVLVLRLIAAAARDLSGGQLSLRAMSLVYTTLLSIVPVLAISFSALKGFGVHNQIEPVLLSLFAPLGEGRDEIVRHIISFVNNIDVGVLGIAGLALLIWSVVSLMKKIEDAFNYTWRIPRARSLTRRFSDYMSMLLVGPLLIFAALGLTASAKGFVLLEKFMGRQVVSGFYEQMAAWLPATLIVAALIYIYMFMPNTRVRFSSALTGALTAGVLLKILSWIFRSFIAGSTDYAAIYSAFAALILFLIWVYSTWLVLLLGASVAFYHQNPGHMLARRGLENLSATAKSKLALMILQLAGRNFQQGVAAWTPDMIIKHLHLPPQGAQEVLEGLEASGLLVRTEGDIPGYQPARPLDGITVKDVLDAMGRVGGQPGVERRIKAGSAIESVLEDIDEVLNKTAGRVTILDLVREEKTR